MFVCLWTCVRSTIIGTSEVSECECVRSVRIRGCNIPRNREIWSGLNSSLELVNSLGIYELCYELTSLRVLVSSVSFQYVTGCGCRYLASLSHAPAPTPSPSPILRAVFSPGKLHRFSHYFSSFSEMTDYGDVMTPVFAVFCRLPTAYGAAIVTRGAS